MAIEKMSGGGKPKPKMMQTGPGKRLRPVQAKPNGPGSKVTVKSVSTGKTNPKAASKSNPSSGPGKRLPGYKPAGPSNISGPGGKKDNKPIRKMPKMKPVPMPSKGAPKPNPTKTGKPGTFGEGMSLLGSKKKGK
jgi:hypothetical protein